MLVNLSTYKISNIIALSEGVTRTRVMDEMIDVPVQTLVRVPTDETKNYILCNTYNYYTVASSSAIERLCMRTVYVHSVLLS